MSEIISKWWLENKYLDGAKSNLIKALFAGLGSAALVSASPFVLERAQQTFYSNDQNHEKEAFAIFSPYIGMLIGSDLLDKLCQHLLTRVSTKIDENIVRHWIEKVNFMTLTQHRLFEDEPNSIRTQLNTTEDAIYVYLQKFYVQGSIQALQVVLLLSLSFVITPSKTLPSIFVGYLFLNILGAITYRYQFYEKLTEKKDEQQSIREQQEDIITHHLLITLYNTQLGESQNLLELEKKLYRSKIGIEHIGNGYDVFSTILGRISLFFILALAANEVLDSNTDFDTNDLVIVILFYQLIQSPIQELMHSWSHIYESEPVLRKLKEVLDTPVELNSPPQDEAPFSNNWRHSQPAIPLIEFRNVSFNYPNTSVNVLQNVSFRILPNTINVVIGESKLGKSTIFRLILQLYNQYSGDIFVNNHDVRGIPVDRLRQVIGLIPQETEFFKTRKFGDNIKIANSTATDESVMQRLREVELGDLSGKLGENVRIEELSGGAKKRVAGVRCLVREEHPLLYIFDEPTTGLDAKIALQVMQQLRTISAQSTVLLVTHQIKFAQSAHQILFMYKDGDQTFLVTGTHNELRLRMDTCGEKYRELDDLQSSQSYANFWVNRSSSIARSGQSSNAATLSRGGDVRDTALSFERK